MADMDLMSYFTIVIIVQLFYSAGITGISYAMMTMPDQNALHYIDSYGDLAHTLGMETVAKKFESSISQQTNVPLIDLAALVFYSGNILLDLLLNFVTATPQMIQLLISAVMTLLSLDYHATMMVQIFTTVLITIIYFIAILQLVTNIRSTGKVI